MEVSHVVLLVSAGLVGGYVAGLTGLGGGIIFAPVLLFHFQSIGVDDGVVAQLTIGSSLMCSMLASIASARQQYARRSVDPRIAAVVGLLSAVSVVLVSLFVTTAPWFDARVFRGVFAALLIVVSLRMYFDRSDDHSRQDEARERQGSQSAGHGLAKLAAVGLMAGAVSTTAGVGGGVILVPAYKRWLGLSMHAATGTSSATIVIIALVGTVNYAILGWDNPNITSTSVGYVDVVRAALLVSGAIASARWGVAHAHRLHSTTLRQGFAVLIVIVALSLAWGAVTG